MSKPAQPKSWEEIATEVMVISLPPSDIEMPARFAGRWTGKAKCLRRNIADALKKAYERGRAEKASATHHEDF